MFRLRATAGSTPGTPRPAERPLVAAADNGLLFGVERTCPPGAHGGGILRGAASLNRPYAFQPSVCWVRRTFGPGAEIPLRRFIRAVAGGNRFIRAVVGDESIGPVTGPVIGPVNALFVGLGLAGFFRLRFLALAALFGFLPLALQALESVVGFTCHRAVRLSGVGRSGHGP